MQPWVSIFQLKKLKCYKCSNEFQNKIEKIINLAHKKLLQADNLYYEAEKLLEQSLGLENFKPSTRNVSIKSFKASFGSSGRLDAEYYQPKYEEFNRRIFGAFKYTLAKDACIDINYGTVPTSPYTTDGTGTPYIKGMNVKNTRIDTNLDRITNTEEVPVKFYTKKDDIIISQMGTVADVGIVTENEENFLFASFTIRLRLKDKSLLLPYYVGLYIQNVAKKWYFYRNIAQASVRQNTDLPTVRNLKIPILSMEIQEKISAKIKESFALRRESENLLEQAKAEVEAVIENGEN